MRIGLAASLVSIMLIASFSTAHAAGDAGGETTQECPAGQIWDKDTQKCVVKSSKIDDDSIYEYGRMLALSGRYGEAIETLSLAADKSDPRILNYLGFSHRKQGRVDVGLGYYEEALKANPDYILAREYMGEAYLQLGDVASARNQLEEIAKRCGAGCDEYTELARQIDSHLKG